MRTLAITTVLTLLALTASADVPAVLETEQIFADFLDAHGAVETIDSGWVAKIDGEDRAVWQRRRDQARAELDARLKKLEDEKLPAPEARVVSKMRGTFNELNDPGASDRKSVV